MSRVNTYTFATYSYPVSVQTNPGTTASGTNIVLNSVYIPANLFREGDTIELSFLVTDNNSSSSGAKECYWNAGTVSISGATYLGKWSSSQNTSHIQPFTRFIHIVSTTQSFIGNTTQSYLTQMSSIGLNESQTVNQLVSVYIDWSVAGYFFVWGSITGDRCQYIYLNRK